MATQVHKQTSVLSLSTLAFTTCFAVWVMFYGPAGGERSNPFAER